MCMRALLKSVLERITPSDEVCEVALKRAKAFLKDINAELKKRNIKAKAVLGGSYAKDTWLAGDYDVDIFVKFNKSYADSEMSDFLEAVLKKWKPERLHGSRDYFWVRDDVKYEIVPVLDIKKATDARNVTDFSPLHVDWVNRTGKNLKDDIRLTKKFCKAAKCYGAESYIRGFSGHVVDILVIHYGGFRKLLLAASKWKPKVVVDPAKVYKGKALLMLNESKIEGPLVVVDPVQPERNAAAALTGDNFVKFVKAAKSFLKSPAEKFFVEQQINLDKLAKKGHLVKVEVTTKDGTEDVAGTKFVRAFEFVRRHLSDFDVKDSGWLWDRDKKGTWWFLLGEKQLPAMEERKGPPLEMKDAVKKFKKSHKSTFTKNKRVWAKVKREYRTPEEVIDAVLKDRYVKMRVKGAKR